MRSICLGVAMLISSVVGAYAQTDAYKLSVEGPGGGAFADVCTSSDVLVGFDFASGDAINQVTAACQSQNNGVLIREIYTLNTWGQPLDPAPPFGTGGPLRCPLRQVISEMTVSLDKNQEVQDIQATCTKLLPQDNLQPTVIEAFSRGTAVTTKHIACSAGDVANGLIGRSGRLIDGVGIQCATFHPPPPTNILKVIAAADVYDHPGGSGQPIYPDGLDPAAPKNIVLVYLLEVGKGDNVNWYRVNWNGSPAQPLWVYSGVTANDQITFDAASLATAIATVNGGH